MWAVLAIAPPESADSIKASPSCKASFSRCSFTEAITDSPGMQGARQMVGGMAPGSFPNTQTPNRVTYDSSVVAPVSLTDQGNAEGVLRGLLKVDLTFVENPTPGDGRPKYLIDSVNNELTDARTDLLASSPELMFSGF